MPHSLYLTADWDITLDATGNIATTSGAYAVAQEVANAVRLFTQDAYFDQEKGIPHFDIALGHKPIMPLIQSAILDAASAVEGVEQVTIVDLSFTDRVLSGELQITTTEGVQVGITI